MVRLSIITINLNNYIGLKNTIESVLNQTFTGFEFIIIDGASTDGSTDLIKLYADRISYWVTEKDSGIYNAMNKGINKASGEYCLFLNSGDWLYSNDVIQEVFDTKPIEDIVYGQQLVSQNDQFKVTEFLEPEYLTLKSFLNSTLPHQCTFIRRALFEIIGMYSENNRIVSDWEFNLLALFKYNCSLRKINVPVAVFDSNGISNKQEFDEIHKIEKLNAFHHHFPRIYSDYHDYNNVVEKYLKIPRIIRKFFSMVR